MSIKQLEVKSVELAFPQIIHLDPHEIEEAKKKVIKLYTQKKLTFVEDYNLAHLYYEGDDRNFSYSLFEDNTLLYFVIVKAVELFTGTAVRQVLIHRNKSSVKTASSIGIARYVVFNKLLPKFKTLASDCQQSDEGKSMWLYLIDKAIAEGMTVQLLDTNDRTITIINKLTDLNVHDVWGTSPWYQRKIITITHA